MYRKKYIKYKIKYNELKNRLRSAKINNYGVWTELPHELYVIGDIHGDFFTLKQSLELTECVNFDPDPELIKHDGKKIEILDGCQYYSVEKKNIKWNPNKQNCTIVFAGDIIDRCRPHPKYNPECTNTINDEDCDLQLLNILFELDILAQKYNSRVIVILGNHELLNLQNDLRYVSNKGKQDNNRTQSIKNLLSKNINNIYGIVRINKYIIVHGGINDKFFNEFNPPGTYEIIQSFNLFLRTNIEKSIVDDILSKDTSPFWDRTLGGMDPLNVNQCKIIFKDNLLKVKSSLDDLKIIVAHCPQFNNNKSIGIYNCQEFENKIIRIDVGMSRAFDSYIISEDLMKLLDNIDFNTFNHLSFLYNSDDISNRHVTILKINSIKETTLTGILSVEYFYNTVFKNKKLAILYLLTDLRKVISSEELLIRRPHLLDCLTKIDFILNSNF